MSGAFYLSPIAPEADIKCVVCDALATHHDDDSLPYCDAPEHDSRSRSTRQPEPQFFLVDVFVYNTRKGFRVGIAYSMPRFYVHEVSHEKATETAMLILGPIAKKAQKFDMTIEAVDEEGP